MTHLRYRRFTNWPLDMESKGRRKKEAGCGGLVGASLGSKGTYVGGLS